MVVVSDVPNIVQGKQGINLQSEDSGLKANSAAS